MMIKKTNWSYPTSIYFGIGKIKELFYICSELNFKKILLVTDKGILNLPFVLEIKNLAQSSSYSLEIFSDFDLNPNYKDIKRGVDFFKSGKFDSIIVLGGGSAMDCGKAIAFMVPQDIPMWEFEDIGDNWKKAKTKGLIPVVAIPTTSGTGSEVGRASVILDEVKQVKKIIFHPEMMPKAVLLDPELTFGLSPKLTAATGLDAWTHSLEAYLAPNFHPLSDGIGLQALKMIRENILTAYKNGNDAFARAQMQIASSMGAIAFQKGLGGIHAISHSIGSIFKVHHGLANAILLPYVLLFNRPVIEKKIKTISNYIQLKNNNFDTFMDFVLSLRKEMNIPHSLKDLNLVIKQENIKTLSEMSLADPSSMGNPQPLSQQDYQTIIKNAYQGQI